MCSCIAVYVSTQRLFAFLSWPVLAVYSVVRRVYSEFRPFYYQQAPLFVVLLPTYLFVMYTISVS